METGKAQDVVEIRLDLAPQDYVRFRWWHLLHNMAFRITLAAAALVLAAIASTIIRPSHPGDVTGGAVVGGLFLGFWLVLVPLWIGQSARRQFATQRAAQESPRVTFSADGLSIASASQSAQQRWSAYWRAFETKHAFYLYVSSAIATAYPKRCFTSEEQMQRFRELVRAGMGERARGIRG